MAESLDELLFQVVGPKTRHQEQPRKRSLRQDHSVEDEEEYKDGGLRDSDDPYHLPTGRSSSRRKLVKHGDAGHASDSDYYDRPNTPDQDGSASDISLFDDAMDSEQSYSSGRDEDSARMTELERELFLSEQAEKLGDIFVKKKFKHHSPELSSRNHPRRGRSSAASRATPGKKKQKAALNNLVARRQRRQDRVKAEVEERSSSFSEDDEKSDPVGGYGREVEEPNADASPAEDRNDEDRARGDDVTDNIDDVDFEAIKSITIRRSQLAKWLPEPYFEEIIVGCFVRVGVGRSKTGYLLCHVTGIEAADETRNGIYKVENRMTNKYLRCQWGVEAFTASMVTVSQHHPLVDEFNNWRSKCGVNMLSKAEVEAKLDDIDNVGRKFVYSADAVKRMLEEKKLMYSRPSNVVAERDRVVREIALAKQQHLDASEIERLQAQLRQIEMMSQQMHVKDAKALALAEMNRRNREENYRNASVRREGGALGGGYDPFSRRWTRSQNYYVKTQVLSKSTTEPSNVSTKVPEVNQSMADAQKKAADAGKLVDTVPPATHLLQLHQFDLPIDLSHLKRHGSHPGAATMAFLARRQKLEGSINGTLQQEDPHLHLRTLTIDDYKRRMNLL